MTQPILPSASSWLSLPTSTGFVQFQLALCCFEGLYVTMLMADSNSRQDAITCIWLLNLYYVLVPGYIISTSKIVFPVVSIGILGPNITMSMEDFKV